MVWEILNLLVTSGLVIIASLTDSPSMVENGLITLRLLNSLDPLEIFVMEEKLDHTSGMGKELNVTMMISMEVGSKLLMSEIYNPTQVIKNQQNGRIPLGLVMQESTNISG